MKFTGIRFSLALCTAAVSGAVTTTSTILDVYSAITAAYGPNRTPTLAPAQSTSLASALNSLQNSFGDSPAWTTVDAAIISAAPSSLQESMLISGFDWNSVTGQDWYMKSVPVQQQSVVNSYLAEGASVELKIIAGATSKAGAARQTGMVVAGVVAGGFAGVLAALRNCWDFVGIYHSHQWMDHGPSLFQRHSDFSTNMLFLTFSDACIWALLYFAFATACPGSHWKRDVDSDSAIAGSYEQLQNPNDQTILHRPDPIPPTTIQLEGVTLQANTSACTAANETIGKRDSTAGATSTRSTFLVIARDPVSAYSAYSGLNDYGIPYELLIVPANGAALPPLQSSATAGNYGGIVILAEVSYQSASGSWGSALTPAQWNTMYNYQVNFGARMVRLDVLPSAATGTMVIGACCGATQEQLIAINDTSAFPTAGLVQGATMSMLGLYHYPGVIADSSIATAFATFANTTGFPSTTVAAVINTFPGRKQMVFFMPPATDWSMTTVVLQHAWIHWATRGLYAGYRRMMLNTQGS
ncbi:hypothetical protein G7Y89_g4760 [Cudoniella acicularis]|uniref:Agd3 CBM87 domain-containing protein n=1 Tax=Cudoniella acicularis TaxID=354080 RepID=A0A8H4RR07_9HELO|nr:hypothetical protein G7Y89_g4760 [Cudoniella acicularis]